MATAVQNQIRLSKSSVGAREIEAASRAIQKGYLGMGSEVAQFEEDLARFIGGGRSVTCVSTGTAALHLGLQACGIGIGDDVLVPTITYVASFQAISATGATPVACDVHPDTCTLDIDDALQRITPHTRAVMPVHYASGPGDLDATYTMAKRFGLRVIEDAAHAFGCRRNGQHVGASGDIVCFSFDGIKNITSGEGGAVVTADREISEQIRDSRLLGVEKDTDKRFSGQRSWEFDVTRQGWRFHMSNIFAAIGRTQLKRFEDEFAPKRVTLAERYVQLLEDMPNIKLLLLRYGDVVPHIFPMMVRQGRDVVRKALLEAGVECGIHYKPNHLLSYYGGGSVSLPQAERLYSELLTIPLHPELELEEQDYIVDVIRKSVRNREGW